MNNKVNGKVLLKETGIGIPDLLVEVYDVDPSTKSEGIVKLTPSNHHVVDTSPDCWKNWSRDRLGSVITDESGRFELLYEDSDFQQVKKQEKRPNLLLLVTAPEEDKDVLSPSILYISCGIRQNAGRVENYILKLSKQQLANAGLELPRGVTQELETPEDIVQRITKTIERRKQITAGLKVIATQQINQKRKETKQLEADTTKILDSISQIPASVRQSIYYLRPGEDPEVASRKVLEAEIANKINNSANRAPIRGQIRLTDQLKQILDKGDKDDQGNYINVPESLIEPYIFGRANENEAINFAQIPDSSNQIAIGEYSGGFFREDPWEKYCREKTQDEINARICLEIKDDENPDNPDIPHELDNPDIEITNFLGSGVNLANNGNTPSYIAENIEKLLANIASPEEPVIFGETPKLTRANQEDIQKNIKGFSLESSPADTTAYYDFHHLQIATNNVVQEGFDRGLVTKIGELQETIIQNGGDVSEAVNSKNPIQSLISGANNSRNIGNKLQNLLISVTGDDEDSCAEHCKDVHGRQQPWLNNCLNNCKRNPGGGQETGTGTGGTGNGGSGNDNPTPPHESNSDLIEQLEDSLKEKYVFTTFATDNLGILVTYRQKWEPINYQVGELVKTIPLALKEIRKFSKKMTVRRKRSEKEVEKSLTSRKEENDSTSRAEDEIVRKANNKTNFNLTASGSYDVPFVGEGSQTSTFGGDTAKESENAKKNFREAVMKSAFEYKQERSLEINTEEFEEFEDVESGEISNPNDELPVTFLFYELQRRYRVSEKIHRLTPVVLVKQKVPSPDEINESWLIAHDWIIKRVILDDSFISTLAYLSTSYAGDIVALEQLWENVKEHRQLVRGLKNDVMAISQQVNRRYIMLEQAINEQAGINDDGLLEGVLDAIPGYTLTKGVVGKVGSLFGFGGGGDEADHEANRIRREAAENAYEKFTNEERLLRSRLDRTVTALNAATDDYIKAQQKHENYKVQILRLRLHIKQNIIYYMQAIWSHESPDKRYLRLHQHEVPLTFVRGSKTYSIAGTPKKSFSNLLTDDEIAGYFSDSLSGLQANAPSHETLVQPDFSIISPIEIVLRFPLAEAADLDNLLGFKGNYMIFPLKKPNKVTNLMMEPYIDKGFSGIVDPDEFGNWTLEDFSKFVCCLKEKNPEIFQDQTFLLRLKQQYKAILTSPRRTYEDIIVPTGSLFIEALPGKHPLLEDFKLMHRAIDVKKVQAEVRGEELENLRMAARLLAEDYEDPDIEKKIVIEGNNSSVIVPSEDS